MLPGPTTELARPYRTSGAERAAQNDGTRPTDDRARTAHRALDDCGVLSAVVERDDEG